MVDSFSSIDTGRDTSLSSGFLDFTEEEKKRLEQFGYDVQGVKSAIDTGQLTKDDVIQVLDNKEWDLQQQAEREVQREEADMPEPQNRYLPASVDYQDVPQQQKGFSWDNFFSTNTGPLDMAAGAIGDTGEFFGTVAGFGIEALGRATNNPEIYKAGKWLKEQSVEKSKSFKDWGMDEGAKADALGPRSFFTYDKPDDVMPSGLGNFNLGTITQLFGTAVTTSGGLLIPAKMIAKKLVKQGMSPKRAGMLGMGLTAGGAEGTMAASDAYDNVIEFANQNPEGIKKSPLYNDVRQKIIAQFPDASEQDLFDFIVDEVAESAAYTAGVPSGAIVGLTSVPMAGFLNKLGFWGRGGKKFEGVRKPWGQVLWGGAWREGLEETTQESSTQLWSNYAEYISGKSPEKLSFKGVPEAAVSGLVGGTTSGPLFSGYSNVGRMSQEEVDSRRVASLQQLSEKEREEESFIESQLTWDEERQKFVETSPFTTQGSEAYIGDSLEAIGLEFEQGDSFETIANNNDVSLESITNLQKAIDLAKEERQKKLPQETDDPYAQDADQREVVKERKKIVDDDPPDDPSMERLSETKKKIVRKFKKAYGVTTYDELKNELSDPNKNTWSYIQETFGKDVSSKLQVNLSKNKIKGFSNKNKEGGSLFEAILTANEEAEAKPEAKPTVEKPKAEPKAKVAKTAETKTTAEAPANLEVQQAEEALAKARKEFESFGRQAIADNKATAGVDGINIDPDIKADWDRLDKAVLVAEKNLETAKLKVKPDIERPEEEELSEAKKKKIQKGIDLRNRTHIPNAQKKIAELKSTLKKSENSKASKKKKAEAKERIDKEIEKYDDRIKSYKKKNKDEQAKLDASKPVTEKKADKKEPTKADKKPTEAKAKPEPKLKAKTDKEKEIGEALLNIVANVTKSDMINERIHQKNNPNKSLLMVVNHPFFGFDKKDAKREEIVNFLYAKAAEYRRANPTAIDKAKEEFHKKVLAASASETGQLSARELYATDGKYALVKGEKYELLKELYQNRLIELRKKDNKTQEDKDFITKWAMALETMSGQAGIVETKLSDGTFSHKPVFYGSKEHIRIERSEKSYIRSKLSKLIGPNWDTIRLFQIAYPDKGDPKEGRKPEPQYDDEIVDLAKMFISYHTPNQMLMDKLFKGVSDFDLRHPQSNLLYDVDAIPTNYIENKDGSVIFDVFGTEKGLIDPSPHLSTEDMDIMYTRILNRIDLLNQGKEVFLDPNADKMVNEFMGKDHKTGQGSIVYKGPGSSALSLKDAQDIKRLQDYADWLQAEYGTDKRKLKRIPYQQFASDEYYVRNFRRATKFLVGDPSRGGGSITKAKKRMREFINDKIKELEEFRSKQNIKVKSKEITRDKADKEISVKDSNLAKEIDSKLKGEMPAILSAYERYYNALRKDGFDVKNLKPNLFEDFTEEEFKLESEKVKQARTNMTNLLKEMFDEDNFIGAVGLFHRTGYAVDDEQRDIIAQLLEQHVMGEGNDEVLTAADYAVLNDELVSFGLESDADLADVAKAKELQFNDFSPTREDSIVGGWRQKFVKKPKRKVLIDKEVLLDPDTDIDAIIESQPEEDWEILRAMVKAGNPIYKYKTVKTPLGVDEKGKRIFKTNRVAVEETDTEGNVLYEMKQARVYVPETKTVNEKIYKSNNPEDYVWGEREVYTGRADPDAPLAWKQEYKIRYLEGNDKGKPAGTEEFVRAEDFPKDVYVKDLYVEKADQKKVEEIIYDKSLTTQERYLKLQKYYDKRKILSTQILDVKETNKRGYAVYKWINKGQRKKEQVLDKEETKRRGYEVYEEVEAGIAIPFNMSRPTYEKVIEKVPTKNIRNEDVVDYKGHKMTTDKWISEDAIGSDGQPIPQMEFVYELQNVYMHTENPLRMSDELPPMQRAIRMTQYSRAVLDSQNSGWRVVFSEMGRPTTIKRITGVPKHIMNQMKVKDEMTEEEVDFYSRRAIQKMTNEQSRRAKEGRDYYNQVALNRAINMKFKTDEQRTDFENNTALQAVIDEVDPSGGVVRSYVKEFVDGKEVLKPISPSMAKVMDTGETRHPINGLRYPTYFGHKNFPGDLVHKDDPKMHIHLEVHSSGNVKEVRVIAEDRTMEGELVGTIVITKDSEGLEKVKHYHFNTAAVHRARLTIEEVDNLIGDSLGKYVADQRQFYTGVDKFATQWGIKKYLGSPSRGEPGYESFYKPTSELIKEIESKAPPVTQIGDAPLKLKYDPNSSIDSDDRRLNLDRQGGVMTDSMREAFIQRMGMEQGYPLKVIGMRWNSEQEKFVDEYEWPTTTSTIDPQTGKKYTIGQATFGGPMGMDKLEPATSEEIVQAAKFYSDLVKEMEAEAKKPRAEEVISENKKEAIKRAEQAVKNADKMWDSLVAEGERLEKTKGLGDLDKQKLAGIKRVKAMPKAQLTSDVITSALLGMDESGENETPNDDVQVGQSPLRNTVNDNINDDTKPYCEF